MTVESLGPLARRYEFLDLLRLLCAASVVLFHYGTVFPHSGVLPLRFSFVPDVLVYGQFGVQIFFMISGFVITLSARGRGPFAFAWARFLRLYPAYWICCTLTALAIVIGGRVHPTVWAPDLFHYLVNMTMVQAFVHVPFVDGVYWSLIVELRFYIIVILCLVLRRRIDALWLLAAWLLACAIAPHAPAILGKAAMTDHAPYFIVGILAQRLGEHRHTAVKLVLIVAALLLASKGIYAVAATPAAHAAYPYFPGIAVAVIWCGALLVGCCVFLPAPSPRLTRILVTIGATTYPLYLLHSSFGAVLFVRLQDRGPTVMVWLGVVAIVFGVTLLISEKVEPAVRNRLRTLGKRLAVPEPARVAGKQVA
ncbi:acyltransferase family protein [Sphingomonas sp. R86520]|uniref:acyltransferase family protein n=1 Tax=Sphingomonas sp. R86520 TaxID=3093859 RepID=UPI0036D3AC14